LHAQRKLLISAKAYNAPFSSRTRETGFDQFVRRFTEGMVDCDNGKVEKVVTCDTWVRRENRKTFMK